MTAENKKLSVMQKFVDNWNQQLFANAKEVFKKELDELIKSEVQKALKDTADFIDLVGIMRDCQKNYFEGKNKDYLIKSKYLERKVDNFLSDYFRKILNL